jgi:hypothetical protein
MDQMFAEGLFTGLAGMLAFKSLQFTCLCQKSNNSSCLKKIISGAIYFTKASQQEEGCCL